MSELHSSPVITRCAGNPLLTAAQVPYDSSLVFNAGVIRRDGRYYMVFRNDYGHQGGGSFKGTNIGLAESEDGLTWAVRPEPLYMLRNEEIRRAYDPRLIVIEDRMYMCMAVDTRHGIRGAIASVSDDFSRIEIISMTVPDNRNMVLFPQKIGGEFVRLERPFPVYGRGGRDRFDIWISFSPDLIYWGKSQLLAGVEDFPFANDKIGPGAPPVLTDEGWLAVCHSVDIDPARGKNGWEDAWKKRYCATLMLLDKENPAKVLGICKTPLLAPETPYERDEGFRTNVIFPTAAVRLDDDRLRVYYGAADTVIAGVEAKISDLLALCK